jgi:hypothetical protein
MRIRDTAFKMAKCDVNEAISFLNILENDPVLWNVKGKE